MTENNEAPLTSEAILAQIHDIQLAQLYMTNRVYDILLGVLRAQDEESADKLYELHKDLQTLAPPLVESTAPEPNEA